MNPSQQFFCWLFVFRMCEVSILIFINKLEIKNVFILQKIYFTVMIKVILYSWNEGLKKVSLTKLQIDLLGKSLKESKSNVDLLLEGNKVTFEVENPDLAKVFLHEADKLGVNCKMFVE